MCRILTIFSQEQQPSSNRYMVKSWIDAWRKATQRDPYLNQVYLVPLDFAQHANGWGVASLGSNSPYIDYSNLTLNLEPAFNYTTGTFTRSVLNSPFLQNKRQILLIHARRASGGTPLTFQQLQPFVLKNVGFELYLSHNGSVDSSVMNALLSADNQLNDNQLYNMSDSQVLFQYLKQQLSLTNYSDVFEVEFWKNTIHSIQQAHYEQNASFKLQLQLILTYEEQQKHITVSTLDRGSVRLMPYYRLYTVEKENFWVCCSSTVLLYFEKDHKADLWEIEPINNDTLVEYGYEEGIKQYKL